MILRSRILNSLATLLCCALLATCTNELEPTGAITVHLTQDAGWPDTLSVAEIATLAVTVKGPRQEVIKTVHLEWESSDSTIVTLTDGASALRATVDGKRPGTDTIVVHVEQTGFSPESLLVPVVVRPRGADSLLTVGDVDTIGLALQRLDSIVRTGATVTWSSGDASILGVSALASDSNRAVIVGRISGETQVVATVQNASGRFTFQLPVDVEPLQIIATPAWSPDIVLNDTVTFAVTILDALGRTRSGMNVQWSSTNESAFAVDSTGRVVAKSRGGGELVASVGAAPFEVAEHRAGLQVVQKWRTVSAGLAHTCAIAALDGTGYCWGTNGSGELGTGLTGSALPFSTRPLAIATSHRFNELQAGNDHTCGEEAQVNLLCWGSRANGQLGDGQCANAEGSCGAFTASEIPVTIIADGNLDTTQLRIEQLVVGGKFTCILARVRFGFINRVRRLRCWGQHDVYSNTTGVSFDSTAATAVPISPHTNDQTVDYVEAAGGGEFVCARPTSLYLSFRIICMGMNFQGELGYGPLDYSGWNPVYQYSDGFKLPVGYSDTSGDAIGPIPLSGIATGRDHTCAFDAIGVVCWGADSFNGHGYPVRADVPVTLVSLTAGGDHTCGLTAAGAAWCWGSNSNGQLANGTIGGTNTTAAPVDGGLTFVALSAGGAYTCGVTNAGAIYCWGANAWGQLGDGTQTDRPTPTRVVEAPQ